MSFVQGLKTLTPYSFSILYKSTGRWDATYRFLKLVTTSQANAVPKAHTIPRTKRYSARIKYLATIFKMSTALNVTVLLFAVVFLMEIEV